MTEEFRTELSNMSEHDKGRLLQCIFCSLDPAKCGASEKEEDSKGMCKKYVGNVLFETKRRADEDTGLNP